MSVMWQIAWHAAVVNTVAMPCSTTWFAIDCVVAGCLSMFIILFSIIFLGYEMLISW